MNKTLLTILGVAAVGYAAYYLYNQSKPKSMSANGTKCMSCGK